MNKELEKMLKDMNGRMDRQEKLMQQLIEMVGKNTVKQEEMDSKHKEMASRLEKMESKQEEMGSRLEKMESKQEEMGSRLEKMESKQEEMGSRLEKMESKQEEMNSKLDRIELAVNRLEQNEPENIIAMLKQINQKLDDRDFEIQALNKRVFKVESEIERLLQP